MEIINEILVGVRAENATFVVEEDRRAAIEVAIRAAKPGDIVLLVKRELREWAEAAVLSGVRRERIVLDPGFGFGKNFDENYPLLARFSDLQALGFPLLAGTSRKSFIGRTLARDGQDASASDRLYGTLASQTALILKGAHIIRTHDVKAAVEAARVADAILQAR